MEMEHINENLIKVLIDTQDLAERGINFLDLIGDQSSIEKFFYSILEEVDVDQHFQESEAVTFQVMPNKDGLELYISRNNFDEMEAVWEDEITKRLLEKKKRAKADRQKARSAKYEDKIQAPERQLIRFDRLEAFLSVARSQMVEDIPASLYAMNDKYYLLFDQADLFEVKDMVTDHPVWTLLEYGEFDSVTEEVLQEHGDLIRPHDALAFFANNF